MRTYWLLASTMLATLAVMPAQAAPLHDLATLIPGYVIAPIEIRELVIKARVAEVVEPLEEFIQNTADLSPRSDSVVVITQVVNVLNDATRACEADEESLDGACVAETILGRMSKSEMVQKVIVRGWDYQGKKSTARLKQLAAEPTMAGAREVLIALLNAAQNDAQSNGNLSEGDIALLQHALGTLWDAWPVKWAGPAYDGNKNG